MVYYVSNAEEKNLIEIEVYWEQGSFDVDIQRNSYDLECHSHFYLKNFLPEFKDRSDCMTDKTLQEFINDIDEIQDFRGYVKEKLLVGVKIDQYHICSDESSAAKKLVSDAAKNILEKFCNKYGFYLTQD